MSNNNNIIIKNGLLLSFGLIGIWFVYTKLIDGTKPIKSSLNGKTYKVRNNTSDPQQSVNKLAILDTRLEALVSRIRNSNTLVTDEKARERLLKFWPKIVIRETGFLEPEAAYVLRKGPDMRFCLRNRPKHGEYEPDNIISFAGIHELAHVMSVGYGHDDEFIRNFKNLLMVADDTFFKNPINGKLEKVYYKVDFTTNPGEYCGVPVTSSPF